MEVEPELKEKMEQILRKLDLRQLADSCNGLRTINSKERESRGAWLRAHEHWLPFFSIFVELVEEVVQSSSHSTGLSEGKLRKIVVAFVREQQEGVGVKAYLLNDVKYSMVKTLVDWSKKVKLDPKLADEVVEYKPRQPKKGQERREPKVMVPPPEFLLYELDRSTHHGVGERLTLQLVNKTTYPLQNIRLRFWDEDRAAVISASDIDPSNLCLVDNWVVVPFVETSMTKEPTCLILVLNFQYLPDPLFAEVYVDFPAKGAICRYLVHLKPSSL